MAILLFLCGVKRLSLVGAHLDDLVESGYGKNFLNGWLQRMERQFRIARPQVLGDYEYRSQTSAVDVTQIPEVDNDPPDVIGDGPFHQVLELADRGAVNAAVDGGDKDIVLSLCPDFHS